MKKIIIILYVNDGKIFIIKKLLKMFDKRYRKDYNSIIIILRGGLYMQDPTVKEMIVEFLEDLKLVSKRSDLTITQYEIALNEFNKYMFENDGKISDMANIRARHILKKWINVVQQEGLSAASLNQRLTALSMFYKFLIGDLYDLVNVVTGIPRFISEDNANDKKKFLYMDEAKSVVKLVEQKDDKKLTAYENARNEIIIKLFLGCGLRISELSKLEYKHINVEEGRIYITSDIAKFKKARVVDVPESVIDAYVKYLKIRKEHKNKSDFLFISRKNNPIHVNTIRDIVAKVSMQATGEKINPHGLRHTYGTQQIAGGQDPLYVSQQMGHANLEITTGIYVHQAIESINRANNNPIFI